jgi:hypothetical protein
VRHEGGAKPQAAKLIKAVADAAAAAKSGGAESQ